MNELIDILHREGCSCVIRNAGTVRRFYLRGVADLYRLLTQEPDFLRHASVADKVVGKAAAALMITAGVQELHADVISRKALDLLAESSVAVSCGLEVQHIVNRAGNGWCPLELLCADCPTARECMPLIDSFVASNTMTQQHKPQSI